MNYNIIAYIVYFSIILFVVLYVGAKLFHNGGPFVLMCYHGNKGLAQAVNKFLLAGYYLMNIGYSILILKGWEKVASFTQLIELTTYKTGGIILLLGIMHYVNIISLIAIGQKRDRHIPTTQQKK
jgi:hypothetical protein